MVETTEPQQRHNAATCAIVSLNLPISGCLLLKPEMSPVLVIVADVIGHQALQMALVEHDNVVEQIAAAAGNNAFGDAVLPGTAEHTAAVARRDSPTVNLGEHELNEMPPQTGA